MVVLLTIKLAKVVGVVVAVEVAPKGTVVLVILMVLDKATPIGGAAANDNVYRTVPPPPEPNVASGAKLKVVPTGTVVGKMFGPDTIVGEVATSAAPAGMVSVSITLDCAPPDPFK